MLNLNEAEKKAFKTLVESRMGEEILNALRRRRDQLVTGWLSNLDQNHGAHMRGKVSEIDELIQTLDSLRK